MNLPTESMLSAYLAAVREAISFSRSLAYENMGSKFDKNKQEQLADLLDAVHVIPELLNTWDKCDEPGLRRFLKVYDRKWSKKDNFS